eukprot:Pgem_evm1s1851
MFSILKFPIYVMAMVMASSPNSFFVGHGHSLADHEEDLTTNTNPDVTILPVTTSAVTILPIPETYTHNRGDLLGVYTHSSTVRRESGETGSGFSITAAGTGSISGAGFTVPGRSVGNIDITLNFPVLSSQNVRDIEALVEASVAASKKTEYSNVVKTNAAVAGSLSFFSIFTGGLKASASREEVTSHMESFGISEENQRTIINSIAKMMTKTSPMKYSVTINNSDSEFTRSGNFFAYTVSGKITTNNTQFEYRVLSDQSQFGNNPGNAAPSN